MSDKINRLIAEALGIEHIFMQEGPYKDRAVDFGHATWITILDGDEIFGEAFPKDWEHDLNAAITLWEYVPDTHTPRLVRMLVPQGVLTYQYRGAILCNDGNCSDHDVMDSSPARAICLSWLHWKGVDVEGLNG